MKKIDKLMISFIAVISLSINITLLFKIISTYKNIKGDPNNLFYVGKVVDNIDYKVYIKDNPYIENNVLNSESSFITDLVDYIDITYNYDYTFDRNVDITYDYYIKARLVGLHAIENNKYVINPVWNKDYILKQDSPKIKANKQIKIDEKISLSLLSYNDLVKNFKTDYDIPLNASLDVMLVINFYGNVSGKEINNSHYQMASIPLGVKAFDIITSKNYVEEEKVYNNTNIKKEIGYRNMIIYLIIFFLLLILTIYIIIKIMEKYRSKYVLGKEKILKQYDERIVEVSNFVKFENWETVDIESFEELLNLSNEAFEPIFFWERRKYHDCEAWFCILREKVLYRFILYKNNNNNIKNK